MSTSITAQSSSHGSSWLDRPGKAYSTGNRQKVALVAAFATRTPLLVLDEPTSGPDPLMEREFRNWVVEARERGQTVFLSSRQLAEVEAVCDRVAILRSGPIGALPVVGGFLLNIVTRGAQAPTWVVNLSPFVHLLAVPDSSPDWVATSAFAVIGARPNRAWTPRLPPPRPHHMKGCRR